MAEALVLCLRAMREDDAPDGDAAAAYGVNEEVLVVERGGEGGMLGDEIGEGDGAGEGGGEAEGAQGCDCGVWWGGEEGGKGGEVIGEDGGFQSRVGGHCERS